MEKKIAIPVENGKLCGHFGHCAAFYMAEIENNQIVKETTIVPPAHEPGLYPAWIAKYGVTAVIAGGMGEKAKTLFGKENIDIYTGSEVKDPKSLVLDFISNNLVQGTNTCNHDHHHE